MNRNVKNALLAAALVSAAGAALVLLARDQITRHRRDLFSPYAFRRLAALGYMAREDTSVDHVTLLRDFIAWEPRSLLRGRAKAILRRMEGEVAVPPEEPAGPLV